MYLFVLGRDKELAKVELVSYLKTQNIQYKLKDHNTNFVALDLAEGLNFQKIIDDLGGTIRIAKVIDSKTAISNSFLEKLDLYLPKKFNYTVSSLNLANDELKAIRETLKNHFKSEKFKATYKTHDKDFLDPSNYFSSEINNGLELIVIRHGDEYIFAQSVASTNTTNYKFKDTKRPKTLLTHSTSFRLAQIMVNLLGLKSNSRIVDPFCGTGTILIEAMLRGYDVIGIDNNPYLIHLCKNNLKWAKEEFNIEKKSEIIEGDSKDKKFKADGAVFEPYMGPFLKEDPTDKKASRIRKDLEQLYMKIFENLNNSLTGNKKIVCIIPYFSTDSRNTVKISEEVFIQNGFKKSTLDFKIPNPIAYDTPDGSTIKRWVYVLEKL